MTSKNNKIHCPHCGRFHKKEYANSISVNGIYHKDYSHTYVICSQNGEAYLAKLNN